MSLPPPWAGGSAQNNLRVLPGEVRSAGSSLEETASEPISTSVCGLAANLSVCPTAFSSWAP